MTGASRGLGRAIARRLAQEGASVAINYSQRRDVAESLASEILTSGGRAIICQADVADSRQVKAMVARVCRSGADRHTW